MELTGKQIGEYEVLSKIGEGGMGEVYRARDKKLGRDVAIKILPAAYSTDPERLRRFEQEAQAAGSLNHPNILVIYHVGTFDETAYIASELLEGETLRDRMDGAALPTRKALDYALQIAHGLAAAHEKRIVHRDLKPENIFITKDGRAKILDFGLAKLTQAEPVEGQTDIPTRKIKTDPGVIMGTIAYMSPEQVRGRQVDHRSDIFSFGAILYEMLTGKKAFQGESTADTMSSILREDPAELESVSRNIAPGLERVIAHCLEKSPDERFHSANDLAFALEALSGSTSSARQTIADLPQPRRRAIQWLPWILAGLLLLGCVTLGVLYFRRPVSDKGQVSFLVGAPEKASDMSQPVISPNGRWIVFVAAVEGKRTLFLRPIDSLQEQRIAGTDDAFLPFWSPDSRSVGFFSNGKLKKLDLNGGPVQTLCDVSSGAGGAWNRSGTIVFGSADRGLQKVSAAGGQPAPAVPLDQQSREIEQDIPMFLPDGDHLLFYSYRGSSATAEIVVASLTGTDRKVLFKNDSNVQYIQPGYILFARETTLMAQPFNASTRELTGDPIPVIENVSFTSGGSYSNFSVSDDGTIVYLRGDSVDRQLNWYDRAGKLVSPVGPPGSYNDAVLSPDEKKVAIQNVVGGNSDVWIIDTVKGLPARFTFGQSSEDDPVWSPDGSYIYFTSDKDGSIRRIYRKFSTGAGNEDLVGEAPNMNDDGLYVSPDGKHLLFESVGATTGNDIWELNLETHEAKPLLNSEFNEVHAHFSPDGHYIAYSSSETGKAEIYIQTYPLSGGKWLVSNGGGAQPTWRRDGKELYYIAADRRLMAVGVKLGTAVEIGNPEPLFNTLVSSFNSPNRYAPSADGQRFLINSTVQQNGNTPLIVITNWSPNLGK